MNRRWLAIPAGLGLLCMGASSTPNYPVTPRLYAAQITNASATGPVTFFVGAAAGTKVLGVVCSSTDTSSHNVTLQILRTNTYPLVTLLIPATAGTVSGIAPISFISQIPGLPGGGEPYFYVESTDTVQLQSDGTVTSGKNISCRAVAADFS